jgi:MFS family permease
LRGLKPVRRAEYAELVTLYLLQGAALSIWFVPLSNILDSYRLHAIKPYAFATSALAAFVSPLIFGAMADRHASPVKVLRGLAFATAVSLTLVSVAIKHGWNQWLVLALIQLHALCFSPTWGISSTIIFARLTDAQREFGPIRATGTFGWMCGCWLVSALNADSSVRAAFTGVIIWLALAVFTFFLPPMETPKAVENLTVRERLGLDGLVLMNHPDHRVVFITVALFSIPLAAFYPFAPPHLQELGFDHTSAWMSLGQVTEILATLSLGWLLNWRLKWIFACGLGFGVLRFVLSALNAKPWLLAGVALHGCSFALVMITAQIYIDQRVDPAWRGRAQALLTLMNNGVGNLIGFLGTGMWFEDCLGAAGVRWTLFWGGLSGTTGLVMLYFLTTYKGKSAGFKRAESNEAAA